MTRNKKLFILVACLALLVALFALKISGQLRRGEDVFWLAELWAPSAVLSVGLVTCIEFMMKPPSRPAEKKAGSSGQGAQAAAVKAPKKAPRRAKR